LGKDLVVGLAGLEVTRWPFGWLRSLDCRVDAGGGRRGGGRR